MSYMDQKLSLNSHASLGVIFNQLKPSESILSLITRHRNYAGERNRPLLWIDGYIEATPCKATKINRGFGMKPKDKRSVSYLDRSRI